jgi:tetratricopeptide (TPR) repeat protein
LKTKGEGDMPRFRSLLALAPLAALCACATAPAQKTATGRPVPVVRPSPDASSYGLFLAGQAAVNHGQSDAAAGYFGQAASSDAGSDQAFLNDRAFTAALLAGDIPTAAALAPTDPTTEPALLHLGALVRGVEALADGEDKKAHAIFLSKDSGIPEEVASSLVAPFAAAASGDFQGATVHVVISGENISQFFANLDQGELFERAGHYDEAETAFRALIARGDPGAIASIKLGELLERRKRYADAVAIYDQALSRNPADGPLVAARARALARKSPPPLASIRKSAAEALMAPATALILQKQEQIALAYLRLALRLDPSRDEAWVMAGDILSNDGDVDAAREAYLVPKPGSDQFVSARSKLAWSYQGAGDKETALKMARETLVADPGSRDASVTLADLLRADERYDESVKVLDGLIAGESVLPDWRLLYMRAVDYEESGRWADAERDLRRALIQRPDEPELLNFLGYSWIDRGEKLSEALAMVQKAVRLDPQSGAMLDSLGWGYYRMGDYKIAVEKLEAAVVLEPADPDVNNHLGDAYWQVGRRTEAQFQWGRVLTLDPSAKVRAAVEAKLKSGLNGGASPAIVAAQ